MSAFLAGYYTGFFVCALLAYFFPIKGRHHD